MSLLHVKTSALVKLVVAGAATAEEQQAAEDELDLRVPQPEVRTISAIAARRISRVTDEQADYHASILMRNGAEVDTDDREHYEVRCDPGSASAVVDYLRRCAAFEYLGHELREERA